VTCARERRMDLRVMIQCDAKKARQVSQLSNQPESGTWNLLRVRASHKTIDQQLLIKDPVVVF
jgi:hypothetical protein